jgi:hypothetical protein
MRPFPRGDPKPLSLIWVDCPSSVITGGLMRALED